MAEFLFDEERHVYTLDGQVLPGVTGVIKEAGLYDFRPGNEWHMELGTYVHQACEYYDKGELDEEDLDETIQPYLEGWKKFRRETGFTPTLNEKQLYHKAWLYAGTLDRLGPIGRTAWLIDIKTGSEQAATAIQTAAYRGLAENEGLTVHKTGAVHLRPDGTYRLIETKDYMQNRGLFLSALSLYRWKENYNRLGR